ncbi:MAG: type II toxin-antitoxin system RelE/ParE family toxin [Candidatus Nanoarchaeia archaeon]|nr:type II toxin-antitoxin system RelE/ParE family toxin [Candidatus Nanoarchaeia archaeon]
MDYSVIFDEDALEYLEKVPIGIKKRICNKIVSTKVNPFYFFKRLEGRDDYKLRVGDYRVIADINSK